MKWNHTDNGNGQMAIIDENIVAVAFVPKSREDSKEIVSLIESAPQMKKRIKELEALKDEVLKVWNEDGDNGEIQMRTPIAWHRVLMIAEKL